MSDGKLDIQWSSDDKELLKSQAKLIRQNEKMVDGYKKLLREAKKAAKGGATELERFAAKTNKVNRTPLQRYREQMDMLNRSLKAGLINQTVYNSAVARAGTTYKASFGGGTIASLGLIATAVMGVKSAWDYVADSTQKANEERRKYADKQTEASRGLGELAQLADTPEDLKRMVAAAKQTYREGGAATLGGAAQLQFSLESSGMAKYRGDVSALQSTGVVSDAASLVDAASALQTALGVKETGEFSQIVSKSLGAAKIALARTEEVTQAAALSGGQAKALGLSDEELLAAVATTSKVTGSAQAAGTQVQSLLKQIEKFGIEGGYLESGKTLKEQVNAIQGLVDSGANVRDVLGDRQEGINAFRTLTGDEGRGIYDVALRNIVRDERQNSFAKKIRMARSTDPIMVAAQLERRNKAVAELGGTAIGVKENLADALVEDLVADLRHRGKSEFKIQEARKMFMRQRGQDPGDPFGLGKLGGFLGNNSETFLNRFGQFASPETRQQAEAVGIMLERSAGALERASDRIEETVAGSQTNAARANQAAVGGAVEAR
jgi:hypothetical protein